MAINAYFFTKSGTQVAGPVTESTLTGRCIDYLGNGKIACGDNGQNINILNITKTSLTLDKTILVISPSGTPALVRGVSFKPNPGNFLYTCYRIQS